MVKKGEADGLIGIVGDRNPANPTHRFTEAALAQLDEPCPFEWIPTDQVTDDVVARLPLYSGLLIAPASPYRSMGGALCAIRFARERGLPLLGT